MPVSQFCSVKSIHFHGCSVEYAIAGDNIEIGISDIDPNNLRFDFFLLIFFN